MTGEAGRIQVNLSARDWIAAIAIIVATGLVAIACAMLFDLGGPAGSRFAVANSLFSALGPALGLAALAVLARHPPGRPLGIAGSVLVLSALSYALTSAVWLVASQVLLASMRGQPAPAGSMGWLVAAMLATLLAPFAGALAAWLARRRLVAVSAFLAVPAGIVLWWAALWGFATVVWPAIHS